MTCWRTSLARASIAFTVMMCAIAAWGMGSPEGVASPQITVMTMNLYSGWGAAGSGISSMGDALESVKQTDFPRRATAIARIVQQQQPHVICLQEVARWRSRDAIGRTRDDIDFLRILLQRLEARGLTYDVVASLTTLDFEAPAQIDGNYRNVRWIERNVMLVRRSPHIQVGPVRVRRFTERLSIDVPLVDDLVFRRGWIAADIFFRGKRARYVCTHLEALSGTVRAAQAAELIDWLNGTTQPVVVLADMNFPPGSSLYQQFVAAGYSDAWTWNMGLFTGPTCCQSGHLANASSTLATRIDYVLYRGALTPTAARRVGHKQSDRTPTGLWPSDHAGVVAHLRLQ